MSKELRQSVWRALAVLPLFAHAATAELLHTTIAARIIASGGFCDTPPDQIVPAPNSNGGSFERNFGGFAFVEKGDQLPARQGMGVGVRVILPGYGPGSPVTVLVQPADDGPSSWDLTVDPDGAIEFGTRPPDGEALPPGRYLLSVLDGSLSLMTFAFTLESEIEDGLCMPAVS